MQSGFRDGMKISEVRAFVAVADTGSMQAASERLRLTQSAVSRLVQRLEADLGSVLFHREVKPLSLTIEGVRALGLARGLLASASSLADAFAADAAPAGTARFGISHALTFLIAQAPLTTVRAAFPAVTLRVSAGWSPPMLREIQGGQLDGAVIVTAEHDAPPEPFSAHRLGIADVVVVAGRDVPLPASPSLAALNAIGWVVHPRDCGYRQVLAGALERQGATPRIVAELFGIELQMALVAGGLGLGLVPFRLVRHLPAAARMRVVPAPELAMRIAIWMARPPHHSRLVGVIDAFEAAIASTLADA